MIEPVAARLGISNSNIFANTLLFDRDGAFADHLRSEPTSRAGGKAKVVAELKASRGYKTVVMIGDGATDMEARDIPGGADAFIGFGGIAVREAVREGADWFVDDFGLLTDQVKGLSAALARSPTVAILANLPPVTRRRDWPRALVDSDVTILEVPLRGDEAQMLESVRILAEAVGERAIVGAGTVLDVIQVREVKAAGARLIVAPNVDAAVIGAAKAHGLLLYTGSLLRRLRPCLLAALAPTRSNGFQPTAPRRECSRRCAQSCQRRCRFLEWVALMRITWMHGGPRARVALGLAVRSGSRVYRPRRWPKGRGGLSRRSMTRGTAARRGRGRTMGGMLWCLERICSLRSSRMS